MSNDFINVFAYQRFDEAWMRVIVKLNFKFVLFFCQNRLAAIAFDVYC